MRSMVRVCSVVMVTVLCSGCFGVFVAGAAGGAAGAIFVKGRLVELVSSSVSDVHMASREALSELGLPIIEDSVDHRTARLRSEYADGKQVWINIETEGLSDTKIIVRVGAFGDQQRSRDILARIKRNL